MSRPTLTPTIEKQMIAAIAADKDRHIVMPISAYNAEGTVMVHRDGLSGIRAQRHLYRQIIGPLEVHEYLKHTCTQKGCLNPYHYRVTERSREALTECINGHAYTPENTLLDGRYRCRTCRDLDLKRRRERNRDSSGTKLLNPSQVNRSKTHCLHNHEFTEENTYHYTVAGRPRRACRTCAIERARAHRRDNRAEDTLLLRKAS